MTKLRAWLRRLGEAWNAVDDMGVPTWPCSDPQPHPSHFWSDGLVGYECDGSPRPA